MFKRRRFSCPCCGHRTLDDESPGSHLICPVCFWEDDPVQFEDPDFREGANVPSLKEAQKNFSSIGCCEERLLEHVRPPTRREQRDPEWQPIK